MNDILKQRLVGALVLVALGVVFWPVIFVESERQTLEMESQIPPMPVLDKSRIEPPRQVQGIAPAQDRAITLHDTLPEASQLDPVQSEAKKSATEAAPAKADAASKTGKEPKAGAAAQTRAPKPAPAAPTGQNKPQLDEAGIPIAWVLQVISVSKKDKAEQLTAELIEQGYKAYHRTIRRDDEVLYRVYIGPVFERSRLDGIKRDIDRQLRVNAIISRYLP